MIETRTPGDLHREVAAEEIFGRVGVGVENHACPRGPGSLYHVSVGHSVALASRYFQEHTVVGSYPGLLQSISDPG